MTLVVFTFSFLWPASVTPFEHRCKFDFINFFLFSKKKKIIITFIGCATIKLQVAGAIAKLFLSQSINNNPEGTV